MRKTFNSFLGLLCLSLLAFSSCTRKALVINEFSEDDCPVSASSGYYDSLFVASIQKLNIDTSACDARLKTRFSNRAIKIAENLSIKPLLCELQRLEDNKASDIEILKIKTELQGRIIVGLADVGSCLSEIECQTVRTRELQIHLNDWISTRLNRATAYSILAGGVTTMVAGLIATEVIKINNPEDGPDLANIAEQSTVMVGAVVGTYYSFRSMAIHKKVKYMTPRNHLAAIFNKQNNQGLFSPFIWNFLQKPFNRGTETTNGIDEVLRKWHELEIPTSKADEGYQEKIGLFAGIGGEYESDDLDNRIEMCDILREEISLINYDLKRLQEEILIGKK